MPRIRSSAPIIIALLLTFILGLLLGRIFNLTSQPIPETVVREDTRDSISVVRIDGISDGQITGIAHGSVRVFLGDQMIIPNGSGAWRVPAGKSFAAPVTTNAPAGMQFVASKRGKKYYPVTSRSAQTLSPANRIYFRDAASAEAAGYESGQ